MRLNYLEFISQREQNIKDKISLNEAFREKDVDKALEEIESILKKHINGILPLVGFVDCTIDDNNCTSKQYLVVGKNKADVSMFQFNWLNSGESAEVYSIDFFKDLSTYWYGSGKSDLTIYTLGSSVARFLPIVWTVINKKKYSLTDEEVKRISSTYKDVKESKLKIGKLNYNVFEGFSKNIINDTFLINSKKNNINTDDFISIIESVDKETNVSVKNGSKVRYEDSESVKKVSDEINSERKDPEQIFKEMAKYISLVIKGRQPSLILCGAPGVGKTYRVKKQLKESGYKEGTNLCTIKGKCTARRLYLALYEYREKNDIILIDDADSLVGPQADENCINILKAALDSSTDPEGRLVSYGVAGKITDDEGNEIPKKCYVKSGVIVITNYRAGALDTALRNRSFMQDIDFSNKEVLSIIEKLLPNIESDILGFKPKIKALKYLYKLNEQGSEMELSLRSFVLCAKIFSACDDDPDFNDEDAQSMIEEQMKLQYARGGHKY